jgi:hypothetical protein
MIKLADWWLRGSVEGRQGSWASIHSFTIITCCCTSSHHDDQDKVHN